MLVGIEKGLFVVGIEMGAKREEAALIDFAVSFAFVCLFGCFIGDTVGSTVTADFEVWLFNS